MMSLPKECPIGPQRKRKSKANLEGPVVRECLQFLKQHPDVIYTERRNTGAVQFQDGGFVRFGSKGAADIFCLVRYETYCSLCGTASNILHVEIEVKRADGKGRQSADQKLFQEFCDNRNIPYILCTSASELAEKLSAICS